VFFRLQLVMFHEGIRSERELMRIVSDRLSARWYVGYDLHEPLPDHSSLTRIRDRFGLSVFREFFERIVQLCVEAGLVWGDELYFDATKVDARVWKQVKVEGRQSPVSYLKYRFITRGSGGPQKPFSWLSEGVKGVFTVSTDPSERTCVPTFSCSGPPCARGWWCGSIVFGPFPRNVCRNAWETVVL
jgi:Transposase domain (DUF772)